MSRGARVHTTNMGDDTPLHLAAAFGNRDIVLMVILKSNIMSCQNYLNLSINGTGLIVLLYIQILVFEEQG